MPSFSEMVEAARPNVREVSAAEAKEMVEADPDVLVPLGQLDLVADPSGPRPNPDLTERTTKLIVTQCATGKRSILAADLLQKLGYGNVVSMKAGFVGWTRQGYPID